jgi:hypothetical protein
MSFGVEALVLENEDRIRIWAACFSVLKIQCIEGMASRTDAPILEATRDHIMCYPYFPIEVCIQLFHILQYRCINNNLRTAS